MRIVALILVAAMTLPLVSGCQKAAPPVVVELKPYQSAQGGFSVDMPQPCQEKPDNIGYVYFYNCPDGSYKVVVNPSALAKNSALPRMERDKEALENLSIRTSTYVGSPSSTGTRRFLCASRYSAYEDKGTTGSIAGNSDGLNHVKIKYTDNEVALPNTVITGSYALQGIIGENCAYVLAVEGKPDFVNSEQATKFFDSFRINGPSTIPGLK